MSAPSTKQLGFDALLSSADTENRARRFERETAHLPSTMAEAIPLYRILLRQHHAAMLAADIDEALRLREEASQLAVKLNDGEPGILADENAPGRVLQRRTAAAKGSVPLWGQAGDFIVTVGRMKVRIAMDGIFGMGARFMCWPGFAAHAVDYDKPFISHTGYRSFLGIHAEPVPGMSVDEFAVMVIATHIERELKGKLTAINPDYREKAA